MPSKFGGVAVDQSQGSRFGGVPVAAEPMAPPVIEGSTNPTEGLSRTERAFAGAGRFLTEQGAGLYQAGVDALRQPLEAVGGIYRGLGLQEGQNPLEAAVSGESQRLQAAQTEREQLGATLRADPYGLGGEIAAGATTLVAPGIVARGTRVGEAFLPRTVTGNARQGAILGGIQPVGEEGSRTQNVFVGGALGGAGAAVPAALGAGARGVRSIFEPLTQSGQESIIGRLLQQSAVNQQSLTNVAPSSVPGVTRTLAEETADPGIGQLQRQFATQLAPQFAENTAARVGAIREGFEGASGPAAAEITSAANQEAARVSGQLRGIENAPRFDPFASVGGGGQAPLRIDLGPVETLLGKVTDARRGNPAIQQALNQVRSVIQSNPPRNAAEAWNVRQYIDRVIEGTAENQTGKAARRELTLAKSAIDRQMTKAFPEWGQFLRSYRGEMTRADQARVGQRLIEGPTGTRAIDPNTGEPILTPANLREGRNADRLVAQATGFPRASAERTLTAPQRSLLTALAEDADRIAAAQSPQRGAAVGSMTADNLATRNILGSIAPQSRIGQLVAGSQPVQRLAALGEKTYGLFGVPQRLQEVAAEALANPARARQIIAALPGPDQALVSQALIRAGGATGQLAAVGQ